MLIAQKNTASAASIAAPIGGWNARDALGEMKPTDAAALINWWPLPSEVMVRNGQTNHATGLPGVVDTLMAYNGPATQKLFAVSGGSIYDVTSGGAVGAASVSSLTNSRWQHINFSTAGGNFLLAVNGADKLRGFDGTNWYADGDGTHDITGVDTATIVHINAFKTRAWMIQEDSLIVWYLGVNAISGAATSINFKSVATRGGYLMAMGTWTIDAGSGVDDHAVFITSQGEVLVYAGTDPSSASTWALVGIWQLGAPIGRRCFMKWQGDLLLITVDGVVPLSGALQSSRVNPKVALTDKIQSAMASASTLYGSNFGWQLLFYPKANMLLLNVPVTAGDNQEQYVMNTISGAWARFQAWGANCWEIFQDEPYFGGNMIVGQAWDGTSDNGTAIATVGKQAFNYFGSRGQLKHFTMIRPIILTNGSPEIQAILDVDFGDDGATALITVSPSSGGIWDSGIWDADEWGPELSISKDWQGVTGIGFCAAPRLESETSGFQLRWVSTDVVFKKGGIL